MIIKFENKEDLKECVSVIKNKDELTKVMQMTCIKNAKGRRLLLDYYSMSIKLYLMIPKG